MKKLVIFVLLVGIVITLGCNLTKEIPKSQSSLQKLEVVKPIVFIEKPLDGITAKISDSIFFYNSTKIEISGVSGGKITYVKNHKYETKDTSIKIFRTIDPLTPGILIDEIKTDNKGSKELKLSFSKNDTTYTVYFIREDIMQELRKNNGNKTIYALKKGSFVLGGNAFIYFKGQKLIATAKQIFVTDTKTPKTANIVKPIEPCRLLYYHDFIKTVGEDYKTAEGWDKESSQTPEDNSVPEEEEEE